MAVVINSECIVCGACIDECPNAAIVDETKNPNGEEIYFVFASKCTECDGGELACVSVCPSDAIHKAA